MNAYDAMLDRELAEHQAHKESQRKLEHTDDGDCPICEGECRYVEPDYESMLYGGRWR